MTAPSLPQFETALSDLLLNRNYWNWSSTGQCSGGWILLRRKGNAWLLWQPSSSTWRLQYELWCRQEQELWTTTFKLFTVIWTFLAQYWRRNLAMRTERSSNLIQAIPYLLGPIIVKRMTYYSGAPPTLEGEWRTKRRILCYNEKPQTRASLWSNSWSKRTEVYTSASLPICSCVTMRNPNLTNLT